jgi:3-deoxy-7-phosphoheptulonate synthase
VAADIAAQVAAGSRAVIGCMLESNLVAGAQSGDPGRPLTYGQSITDACIGWDDSEQLLEILHQAVAARRG